MKTYAKINLIKDPKGSVKAFASLTIDDSFAVNGIKIIEGKNGMFISMPQEKRGEDYHDLCFPVTKEAREQIINCCLDAYNKKITES